MDAVKVRLQYFDDCPSWQQAASHLQALRDDYDLDIHFEHIDTYEAAQRLGFRGSPTILVDDCGLFDTDGTAIGLSCRRYPTPSGPTGCPTRQQIADALTQRLGATRGSP